MKLLYKLLRQNISPLQVAVFLAVNLLGGLIVLLGVKAWCDYSTIVAAGGDALSSGMVVVNKELPASATISSLLGKHPVFSDDEIAELEALPSVASVGRFVAARFEVGAVLTIASARMSTDIFLEAVPDEFITGNYTPVDGVSFNWSAGIGNDTVPVIIPRNYLNLYNFGYAASNGMPQISDSMLGYLPLRLVFRTATGKVSYNAVLCGLTDKFNTILVPWDFLHEANSLYAPGLKDKPSRLMLATNAGEFDESTLGFLSGKGYIIEGDSSPVRLQNMVFGLIYIIIGVGGAFSLLAFILLVISIQLLIEKNRERIYTLYSIGYPVKVISGVYRLVVSIADVAVWTVAATLATLIYPAVADVLRVVSPLFEPASAVIVWSVAICLALMFAIMHSCIIFVNVKKHCR